MFTANPLYKKMKANWWAGDWLTQTTRVELKEAKKKIKQIYK